MELIWSAPRGIIYPGETQPTEPPEDVVCGYCPICKDEVYIGENVYGIDGKYIHEECIGEFAKDYFAQYLIRV